MVVIEPKLFPWHRHRPIRAVNERLLAAAVRHACAVLEVDRPIVLAANPTAAFYLDKIPHAAFAYLRLDDYARLPGVDADLAREAERAAKDRAQVGFATARTLMPEKASSSIAWYHLPQGVDVSHFARVPLEPPQRPVLGFFGLLAEWIDFELIAEVAQARPEMIIELRGPVRSMSDSLRRIDNVRILPPVSYAALPQVISHWSAGFLPFRKNDLTRAVNPLKAREYLAAGLPSFATALPELAELEGITVGQDAGHVIAWLEDVVARDSVAQRTARRRSMLTHDWRVRSSTMRSLIASRAVSAGGCTGW